MSASRPFRGSWSPGSRFDVPAEGANRLVSQKPSGRHAVDAERRAVVDERTDRQLRGHAGNAADVIGMVVGYQQVVEMVEARLPGDRKDPLGITAVARVSGIDQERFAAGCDQERRLPALDVDEIDLESPGRRPGRCHHRNGNEERDREDEAPHAIILVQESQRTLDNQSPSNQPR